MFKKSSKAPQKVKLPPVPDISPTAPRKSSLSSSTSLNKIADNEASKNSLANTTPVNGITNNDDSGLNTSGRSTSPLSNTSRVNNHENYGMNPSPLSNTTPVQLQIQMQQLQLQQFQQLQHLQQLQMLQQPLPYNPMPANIQMNQFQYSNNNPMFDQYNNMPNQYGNIFPQFPMMGYNNVILPQTSPVINPVPLPISSDPKPTQNNNNIDPILHELSSPSPPSSTSSTSPSQSPIQNDTPPVTKPSSDSPVKFHPVRPSERNKMPERKEKIGNSPQKFGRNALKNSREGKTDQNNNAKQKEAPTPFLPSSPFPSNNNRGAPPIPPPKPKIEVIIGQPRKKEVKKVIIPKKKKDEESPQLKSLCRITNSGLVFSNENIEDIYDFQEQLGTGAFATVIKAYHINEGVDYAVKIIEKKKYKNQLNRLVAEMEILQSVNHPNIIHMKEIFEMDEKLYIVTELAEGGELFDRLVKKNTYSESEAATLIKKLLSALSYLHRRNIIHRDLKPENLLLRSEDNNYDILIADFGLSKLLEFDEVAQTTCGTPIYIAPEVISQTQETTGYSSSVDLWTVGVITYILLAGKPPFYHKNIALLFQAIRIVDYEYPESEWSGISDTAIQFIDQLLVADPEKRMNADQALLHQWIKFYAFE